MKATLEFDLDDPQDAMRHRRLMKADDMCHVLWEIVNGPEDDFEPSTRKEVREMCEDNNICFEEIWT